MGATEKRDVLDLLYEGGDESALSAEEQGELAKWRELRGVMRELPQAEPRDDLSVLMAAAREHEAAKAPRGLWARVRTWFAVMAAHPAMSAAATVVVVAGVAGAFYMTGRVGTDTAERAPASKVDTGPLTPQRPSPGPATGSGSGAAAGSAAPALEERKLEQQAQQQIASAGGGDEAKVASKEGAKPEAEKKKVAVRDHADAPSVRRADARQGQARAARDARDHDRLPRHRGRDDQRARRRRRGRGREAARGRPQERGRGAGRGRRGRSDDPRTATTAAARGAEAGEQRRGDRGDDAGAHDRAGVRAACAAGGRSRRRRAGADAAGDRRGEEEGLQDGRRARDARVRSRRGLLPLDVRDGSRHPRQLRRGYSEVKSSFVKSNALCGPGVRVSPSRSRT
jgi:hypothetical protein